MSETINFTRLTTSDKLPDRFLTCQFYQPVDPEQIDSGVIFSQIEILTPWFPSSQIGQTVINTLIREYYRGTDTSDLVNFESAIKGVNRALSQFAQNGETDWIGKLSGVLILINKKEIHIAQTGHSHAYLYRSTKINHITEGLDIDDEPHPLKTFTNLTSGSLQLGDKIVIANSAFFENIAPSELKLLVNNYRPTLAAIECARILKSHGNRVANAIFLESTTKEELANIPPEQKIESVYLDQSGVNFSLVTKNFFKNSFAPALSALGRGIISGARATGGFIAPKVKKGWERTRRGPAKSFETAQNVVKEVRKQEERANYTYSPEAEGETEKIIPKKSFLRTKNKLRRILITFGLYSRDKSKMILGIFIVVVLILAGALTYSFIKNRGHTSAKELEQKYAQLTSLDGEASIAASKRDDSTALQKYKEIYAIALELQGTQYADKIKSFLEKASTKITEITKLKSTSPLKTLNLGTTPLKIGADSKRIIEVLANGEIKEKKATDADFVTLLNTTLPSNKVVSLTQLEEADIFALVFDNKALSILDPIKKTVTTQEVKLKNSGQIKSFGENIYLLDTTNNQIWKITAENSKYNSASAYLKDQSIKITDAVDLAIDGSVYTLNGTGQILEFSRGTKINEFRVTLPGSEILSSYKNIFTSENSTSIFIVAQDGNQTRVIEVKKNGNFLAQYYLEGADGFQDIIINSYLREVYVLKDNKILEYRI